MSVAGSNICIIPARGGSKRIPKKNVKIFSGKPIIAYSIEAALLSGLFDLVMVSTDDPEIALIAEQYGAQVPFFRTAETANDFATTLDVLREVLAVLNESGKNYDNICCLYPTAPFVTPLNLLKSFNLFESRGFDTVFPIIKFSFPIQRSLIMVDEQVSFENVEYVNSRSQDLPSRYHDAGQYYWTKRHVVLNHSSLLTKNSGGIEISELEGQDIDNEIDWKIAELKYELLQSVK